MKKIFFLLTGILLSSTVVFGETGDIKKYTEEKLADYIPKISGDLCFTAKKQDAYHSPLDIPEWGWGQRAGASNRDTQILRAKGNVNLYAGTPGKTEWFAVATFSYDANDPDNMNSNSNNVNEELKKLEIGNALLMWRPIKVLDSEGNIVGRPFGITIGQQTIKESANAAFNYLYKGDPDDDFVGYTLAILQNKPMVNLDFHISENTGIGYAFAKGSSDIIQVASAFSNEYSLTHVVYGEAGFAGVGFNTALQISSGNRSETESVTTDKTAAYGKILEGNPNKYSYKTAKFNYTASAFNTSLNYNLILGNSLAIKPFLGYQLVSGDQAQKEKYQELGDTFATRKMEASFTTVGGTVSTKISDFNVRFAAEYTKIDTPAFDGLGGVEDGEIDSFAETAKIPMFDKQKMAPGNLYTKDKAFFKGIAGGSKSAYTISGIDNMMHIEAAIDLNENVTLSLFMYQQNVKDVKSLATTTEQKNKLADIYSSKFGYFKTAEVDALVSAGKITADIAKQIPTAEAAAEKTAATIDTANGFGTEWKNSTSYGMNVLYKF